MNKKYQDFLDLVIYQIYPRSFNDSNGDGIGDIPGVIEKLDYLRDLGVNAIWLCPCYKSPNYDNGYDIADYRDIMDEFGTLEDIKRLIAEMHARDMKLIMDLVPNHTSHQHKWFIESRKSKDNPYSEYYYWFDQPINDWQQCFGGSAWEYDELRGQYYLHSYTPQQPDLNWDNPAVVKEIQDVVDYWVDLGVDGFRCDVIDQISKDFEHGNNCFGPNLHKYIHALFGRDKTAHLFTVGECWAVDIDEINRHCAEDRGELSTLFQFDHFECGRNGKFVKAPCSLTAVRDILVNWQELCQRDGLLHSLFTDNHDHAPYISRVGNDQELRFESATCLATMFFLLRGVPFIYQGQEIGVTSSQYDDISCFDDIESHNKYNSMIESGASANEALAAINFGGRDNARRPMPWNGGEYGGFSDSKPWIQVSSRLSEINLEKDLQSEKSVNRFYKDLLALRRSSPAFRQGSFKVTSSKEDPYFIYERALGDEKYTVICNFEKESVIAGASALGEALLVNYADRIKSGEIFRPYEIAVYKE
ncbi:MAG: alpha-glucosidase [Acutalibacteraceae bacterium]